MIDEEKLNRIRHAVALERPAIESAFYEGLYASIYDDSIGEVATLIRFFALLPTLQVTLSGILKKRQLTISLKGVFCHYGGWTGPVVEFAASADKGCELCDLLVLVTYGTGPSSALGNACFLQAKRTRDDLEPPWTPSTVRQRKLYEQAMSFTFVNPGLYESPELPESTIRGSRDMPPKDSSGFCYWPFAAGESNSGYRLNSSSIIRPSSYGDSSKDVPCAEAFYRLMTAELGLPVAGPTHGEYGWNRVVRDVTVRAMAQALNCSAGIADVRDLPRVHYDDQLDVLALLSTSPALVANPFAELSAAFGDEFLDLSRELEKAPRLSREQLMSLLQHASGDGPPRQKLPEDDQRDGDGGATFLQIHIAEEGEPTLPAKALRKISLRTEALKTAAS